jgi:hypothetical protein
MSQPPYGWREGQDWSGPDYQNRLKVSKESMETFLERYTDADRHGRVMLTPLGYTCVRRLFGEDFRISRRGPNDYNIHQTHNGETHIFTLQLFSDDGSFEPKFFGEDMVKCLETEETMDVAMEVGEAKGLDPYMMEKHMGEFLGGPSYKPYRQREGGKKTRRGRKRRSTRRKHTLIKRRNVRMHRL